MCCMVVDTNRICELRMPVFPRTQMLLPRCRSRYAAAIRDAALSSDMATLPEGDLTNVGEGGVLLSGGQRARVAFARVLFAGAEIALLEDIFAAVDAITSRQLWRTICKMQANGVTIVLVTNQAQLFSRPEVGRLAVVHNGQLCAVGSFAEVTHRGYQIEIVPTTHCQLHIT